jgi:hypothetical protein
VNQRFGPVVAKLIDGVLRMAAISASLNPRDSLVLGSQAQVETWAFQRRVSGRPEGALRPAKRPGKTASLDGRPTGGPCQKAAVLRRCPYRTLKLSDAVDCHCGACRKTCGGPVLVTAKPDQITSACSTVRSWPACISAGFTMS